jgi:hypothetical protein
MYSANNQHLLSQQEERTMDEKHLLELWNKERSQIIHAQLAPAVVLIGILVLAAIGGFENATTQVQYLAIGITVATGILAVTSQLAAIREGEAIALDLQKVENPSHLAQKVASSSRLLSLNTFTTSIVSLAVYALVIYAIFG